MIKNFKGWNTWISPAGQGVIYPNNDTRKHDLLGDCWCEPRVDTSTGHAVRVHKSGDGREKDQQS